VSKALVERLLRKQHCLSTELQNKTRHRAVALLQHSSATSENAVAKLAEHKRAAPECTRGLGPKDGTLVANFAHLDPQDDGAAGSQELDLGLLIVPSKAAQVGLADG
jgi:hypothetical protein